MAKSVIDVRILGNNKDLRKALDDSGSRITTFGKTAGKALKAAAIGIGALGAGALIAGPKILSAGASLEAMGIKSATVFGDSLGDVEAWADEVAGSMGLTSRELAGVAAGMGDLLKPMGFTAKQAADMSTDMIDLSGALSAWSEGQYDSAEVADILSKAMLGEREQLKSLGISITEADVKARLALNGQQDLTGAALAQAKALATQELILAKSTDAQAAWTDGSFDNIKAQNQATAAVGQLKESVIAGLYPAIQTVVPLVSTLATWLGDNLPAALSVAGGAMAFVSDNIEYIAPVLTVFAGAIVGVLVPAFISWATAAGAAAVATLTAAAPALAVGAAVAALAAGIVYAYKNIEVFRETVDTVAAFLKDVVWPIVEDFATNVVQAFGSIVSFVQQNWPKVQAVISVVFDKISNIVRAAMQVVQGVIRTVTAIISGDWSGAWEGIRQIISGVWDSIKAVVDLGATAIKAVVGLALDGISTAWFAAWGAIASFVDDTWESIKSFISGGVDSVVGFVTALPGRITSAVAGAFDGLRDAFRNALNFIIDGWNGLEFSLPSVSVPFVGTFGGQTIGTPDLPRFHTGGPVGDPNGAIREVPALLLSNEEVLTRSDPRHSANGGGRTIIAPVVTLDSFDPTDDFQVRLLADRIATLQGMAS